MSLLESLDACGDVVRLAPQFVSRFYGDGGRLGQRQLAPSTPSSASAPTFLPERWIASSIPADPVTVASGGLSICSKIERSGELISLKALLADPEAGPRLLGEGRFEKHSGAFRVLLKVLDPGCPIPVHAHASDAVIADHDAFQPGQLGKDEAHHYLDAPKGGCPYTHLGVHAGVTADHLVAAMKRGADHVLELLPSAYQRVGEGWQFPAGLLHRPGSALTLAIQQPSDVYTMFQRDFDGKPLDPAALHPGFGSIEKAAERVVDWERNAEPELLEKWRLTPQPISTLSATGAKTEWVFPSSMSKKFSGMRLTIDTDMTFKVDQPCVLFAWRGKGLLDELAIEGAGGPPTGADEFFLGVRAAKRGLTIHNVGDEPLVLFAIFAASL